jgi:hypothetical protein
MCSSFFRIGGDTNDYDNRVRGMDWMERVSVV